MKSCSVNQTIVALSSGEAEVYATNKGAAQALGLRSLLADLGIQLDIKRFTDSPTAKAIIQRTGLGKRRHLDTNELWLHQKVKDKDITHHKVKNTFNVADILTKATDFENITRMMELMNHRHEHGRSLAAPELNEVGDMNGMVFFFANTLDMPCRHM